MVGFRMSQFTVSDLNGVDGTAGPSPEAPIRIFGENAGSGVRIDKWLWAARFFKTRSLAGRACELGRVEFNGQRVKPAREVHLNDRLLIRNDSGDFEIDILELSDLRGPATVARTLYRETEASLALRLKLAQERKMMPHFETTREGRPSKRDRRKINQLRSKM